jgi:5-methylcytosine-specific restriction endonuclease McrA
MRRCTRCGIKLRWNEGQDSYFGRPQTDPHDLLCFPCYTWAYHIYGLVRFHCQRAKKCGLPATLTVEEWLATEQDFQGKCAYCRVEAGTVLEHYMPISCGGGTVKSNCVPACDRCNKLKWHKHPNQVTLIPQEDMKRVSEYLILKTHGKNP